MTLSLVIPAYNEAANVNHALRVEPKIYGSKRIP